MRKERVRAFRATGRALRRRKKGRRRRRRRGTVPHRNKRGEKQPCAAHAGRPRGARNAYGLSGNGARAEEKEEGKGGEGGGVPHAGTSGGRGGGV